MLSLEPEVEVANQKQIHKSLFIYIVWGGTDKICHPTNKYF